jgi:hypothetical protein
MSASRILVTGSRDWDDAETLATALDEHAKPGSVLIHGGARGADRLAGRIWDDWIQDGIDLLPAEVYPADWSRYGKAAGYRRNAHMVALGATVCLAFPLGESRGTRGCMALAEKAGIPVISYEPT